ncbi:methyl-accepting chemotaxis protein [Brevibacillus sp. WF146]|uniref:HAMP domain-containing protein n=1 Tax=Brevibacillus sp. WF146 TaxID=319501 RepID=UPI0007ED438D|nr:HAMP domain-containing methyl-accepting chemotaxis protein [Brevibacillus sp. WF146]UYZ13276.1 methyl-accepting chemotaxis protein [Brevibacillus sp. WF146]
MQTKLAAFSEGDLFQTMQVNTRDEIRQLGDSFNRMSGQIRTIIGKIQRVIADVKHVAEHVGKGSRHSHAMQTEDATERIQQVIASGQARMDLVTERMTVTDHATVDGLQTLHEAADVFSRIVAVSEILTEQFAVIGRLSRSISRQSQDIKEGVDALSHSAQAVTAGTQQAVAATQESVSLSEQFLHDSERLAAIVDDLEQEIRFFRTAAAHVPDAADGSIVRPLPASS